MVCPTTFIISYRSGRDGSYGYEKKKRRSILWSMIAIRDSISAARVGVNCISRDARGNR